MNVLKLALIILLTFSIDTSGRIFDDLFTVKIPQNEYSITNDGLILAFNQMSARLTGTKDTSVLKSLNALGINKSSFVESYKVIEEEGLSFLEVIFNKGLTIKLFREQNIPIFGINRPEITILAKVDDGKNNIFYISGGVNYDEQAEINNFVNSLKMLSQQRGLHIDLPLSDIKFSEQLNNETLFSSFQDSIKDLYSYSFIRELEIFRDSVSTWTLKASSNHYRFNTLKQLFDFALSAIEKDIDSLLFIDRSPESQGQIIINAVNLQSFEDFKNFEAAIEEIFAISNLRLSKASKDKFIFKGNIEYSINQIKKELSSHSYLQLLNFDENQRSLTLKFK